jgi:hypothetical protein
VGTGGEEEGEGRGEERRGEEREVREQGGAKQPLLK